MRHPKLTLLLAAGALQLTPAAQAASLVGWYQFNDAGNLGLDSSAYHNDGTVYNDGIAPVYSSASSIEGGGSAYFGGTFNLQNYNFQGGGGRIDVPVDTGPFAMQDMTWGAWVKAEAVDHGRYVLSSDRYNGGRTIGVDNRASDNVSAIVGNQAPWVYDSGVAAPIGSWIFIGAVYRNNVAAPGVGDLTLYVGNQVFTSIVTHIGPSSPDFTSIGGDAGGERYWKGYIDNVFIFNGALSQAQMAYIISNPGQSPLGAIPEPSSYGVALGGLALAVAAWKRRRTA